METSRRCKVSQWNNLHADILETIFKNLSLGDRVRARVVCRYWNLVMSQDNHRILGIPESSPWQIGPEDRYYTPPLTKVSFKSLSEQKIYHFSLPDDGSGVWFCGSSHGWLLMATGDYFNPNLFLWNPLNGSTRNLPPLSSHPCYREYRYHAGLGLVDVMRAFDRVLVFSHGSADCVVAVIFNKHVYPKNRVSFCMPHDQRWTTYGEKEDKTNYIDIMYHEKLASLWLLLTTGDSIEETLRFRGGVCLSSGCTVPISFSFLNGNPQEIDPLMDEIDLPDRSLVLTNARQVFRLVDDEDGDVLVVATNIDRVFRVHDEEVMVCDRIGKVSFIVPCGGELTSIGNRTVFLGSTATNSIIISNPIHNKGIVKTDCVYLAIDDSYGYCYRGTGTANRKPFTIRERGVYFLKSKKMENDYYSMNVNYFTRDKIGWFEPKILLK